MTRDEVIAALMDWPKFGNGPGHQRMAALTHPLPPTPWFQTGRALHVTGSQGKGTVATLTAAILEAYGLRVGLYLSPHLFRFEERIVIAGAPVGERALANAFASLQAPPGTGAFEMITATALAAFARAALDTVVLEAGIGGRHDSTKIAGGAVVALTGIDREHLDLLGPTEANVLRQKIDLCPPGGTLIAGALGHDLDRVLRDHGRARGITVRRLRDEASAERLVFRADGVGADFHIAGAVWNGVRTRLFGPVQIANALLAVLTARTWLERFSTYQPARFEDAARRALAQTTLPLRFQRLTEPPAVYADVAHTPVALHALTETVRHHLGERKLTLILGVSEGRDPAALGHAILPIADAVICSSAAHRGQDPARLAAALADHAGPVDIIPDLHEALAHARALGRDTLVTGSLFIARDAAALLAPTPRAIDISL